MSELVPAFRQQFFDSNGKPLAGGFIYSYIAGTTTPLATYTDETGATPNTNPVVLDSSGTAKIWMANASYKFVLQDSLGNLIETVDEVLSTAAKIAAAVNVAGALDILNNLSDVNNAQTSLNNLVGAQSTGTYLRSNGTNVSLSAIQSADVPTPGTNVVTNASLAQMNSHTLKGNNGGSTANAADLTVTQVNTMLGTLTNPMTTSGDIIYGGASGVATRLPVGSNTNLLTLSSGIPAWEAIPTWNQNTTGSAASISGNLTGDATSVGMATTVGKINGTSLAGLTTGILKNTTTTGVPSIATAGTDYVVPSGNITGTAANITGTTNATLTTLSSLSLPQSQLSGVVSAPTASTVVKFDANKNLSGNAFIPGFTTTATAAGTTVLTVASTQTQYFTGVTTQTVTLPTTSLVAGAQYLIENKSTGIVTVQSSGANTIVTLSANTGALFTALVATPTTAANWDFEMTPTITGSSSGNIWTSTGATSAPTWQAPSGTSPTGSYAQAFFGSASSWSTSATSYADPTNSGGSTLTVRKSSGITLTAAAATVCGITFTPASSSAVYLITARTTYFVTPQITGMSLQLTDGTTVIAGETGFEQQTGGADVAVPTAMTGIYAPGTASAVTVKIQMQVSSGATGTVQALSSPVSVEWTVLRIF